MAWWAGCLERMGERELCDLLITAWAVWGARCKMLMENEGCYPVETLAYARKICRKAQEACQARPKQGVVVTPHPGEWSKPSSGFIKLNVDAGFIKEMGCGLGVVYRDEYGEVLAAGSFQFHVTWEPRITEAKAIFHGMKLAHELGYSHIEVESDSLLAIQALRSGRGGSSEFNLILDDVLNLALSFDNVIWSFVKRYGNKVAHMLAHFQPWEPGKRTWIDDLPIDVISFALNDII